MSQDQRGKIKAVTINHKVGTQPQESEPINKNYYQMNVK
jgi:hypothetical protein